jgi:hypothetical protein
MCEALAKKRNQAAVWRRFYHVINSDKVFSTQCQNARLKNLDTFRRIKLLTYFEDEPIYPSGPPRRISGACTQQNAV